MVGEPEDRLERVAVATEDLIELIRSRPDLVEKISWWVEDNDAANATVYSMTATLRFEGAQRNDDPTTATESPKYYEGNVSMPWVVCSSRGGPYQVDSYIAGFESGRLDGILECGRVPAPTAYHTPNQAQLDLIAMRHGYTADFSASSEEWVWVEFREGQQLPPPPVTM